METASEDAGVDGGDVGVLAPTAPAVVAASDASTAIGTSRER
jgi:hypothetical protein